jgi:hypothetical protein
MNTKRHRKTINAHVVKQGIVSHLKVKVQKKKKSLYFTWSPEKEGKQKESFKK